MRFGLREKVFGVLLISIPVLAMWFVFRPYRARNAKVMAEVETAQAKLKALESATGTIDGLNADIRSLSKVIDFFNSRMPQEKEIDKILLEAWQMAEANRLTTKSIRPLDPNRSARPSAGKLPCGEQPIAVHLEGDFMGFYAFLLALESQPRLMRIDQMNLEVLQDGPAGHMRVNFVMSVFFDRNGPTT